MFCPYVYAKTWKPINITLYVYSLWNYEVWYEPSASVDSEVTEGLLLIEECPKHKGQRIILFYMPSLDLKSCYVSVCFIFWP